MAASAVDQRWSFRSGDQREENGDAHDLSRGPTRWGVALPAIAVVVIDGHKRTREGLGALFGGTSGIRIAGLFSSAEEALRGIQQDPPDVLLMNIAPHEPSDIAGLERIRTRY